MIKLIVLGTAQDGGVPHLGCERICCQRARQDARFGRLVTSLGLIDSSAQKSFLIDATPDVRPQLDYLVHHPLAPKRADRNPIDGLILTHAHIGHYTGLIQFSKEVMATRLVPTWCTLRMADFLRANGPWAQLVRDEHLQLFGIKPNFEPLGRQTPGAELDALHDVIHLTDQLSIVPFVVPHRQEWSDTLGLEIVGPNKRVVFIPDIDRWSDWMCDVREVVEQSDLAFLDGSFYSGDELPGRDMSKIPHPLVTETMERLAGLRHVYFVHLNHTNPALDATSSQRKTLEVRGFRVAEDRMEFEL